MNFPHIKEAAGVIPAAQTVDKVRGIAPDFSMSKG